MEKLTREELENMSLDEFKRVFERGCREMLREMYPKIGTDIYEEFIHKFSVYYREIVKMINMRDKLEGGKGDWTPDLRFWIPEEEFEDKAES